MKSEGSCLGVGQINLSSARQQCGAVPSSPLGITPAISGRKVGCAESRSKGEDRRGEEGKMKTLLNTGRRRRTEEERMSVTGDNGRGREPERDQRGRDGCLGSKPPDSPVPLSCDVLNLFSSAFLFLWNLLVIVFCLHLARSRKTCQD